MNKKNFTKTIIIASIAFALFILIIPFTAHAESIPQNCSEVVIGNTYTNASGETISGAWALIQCYVDKIFTWVAGIAALISVLTIIYSGFLFITSAGNPDKIKTANKALTGAIIGLIIVLLSYAITIYIHQVLTGTGTTSTQTQTQTQTGPQPYSPITQQPITGGGFTSSFNNSSPPAKQPVVGSSDIVLARIDTSYSSQSPQGLILNLPTDWQWTTTLDQSNIQGIQDQANQGNLHMAALSKQESTNTLKRSATVKDDRNVSPWGAHIDPEAYYSAVEELGKKDSPPSAFQRVQIDGKPTLAEIMPSIINGIQYVQVQVTTVYCDSVYSILLNNKVIPSGSTEQDFINWASGLKFNYTCQPVANAPPQPVVLLDAYTIALDNGQKYSINIEDGKPFVVDNSNHQSYEIKSEKFGTYAKIDKKSLAYKRSDRGQTLYLVGTKKASFGIVDTDNLPFKYIEFDTDDPKELNGTPISKNDEIVGKLVENYLRTNKDINLNGIDLKFVGNKAVEYYNNYPDDFAEIASILNKIENKFNKRVPSLSIVSDGEDNSAYVNNGNKEYSPGIVFFTGFLDTVYSQYKESRMKVFEAALTHEYGHFIDDVIGDGLPDGIYYSGLNVFNERYSEFASLFANMEYLFATKGVFTDGEDISTKFNDHIFYDWPNEGKAGHPEQDESELFATTFVIYNIFPDKFEKFYLGQQYSSGQQENNIKVRNIAYTLYLMMGKILYPSNFFLYNTASFEKMTASDIVAGDFASQLLPNEKPVIAINNPDKKFSSDCTKAKEEISKQTLNKYLSSAISIKGVDVSRYFAMVAYKNTAGIGKPVNVDLLTWNPIDNKYDFKGSTEYTDSLTSLLKDFSCNLY